MGIAGDPESGCAMDLKVRQGLTGDLQRTARRMPQMNSRFIRTPDIIAECLKGHLKAVVK